MQGIFLTADNHGVTGVVATVELDHIVNVFCQKVCGLALALIAPLSTNNDYRGHEFPSPRSWFAARWRTPQVYPQILALGTARVMLRNKVSG